MEIKTYLKILMCMLSTYLEDTISWEEYFPAFIKQQKGPVQDDAWKELLYVVLDLIVVSQYFIFSNR